MVNEAKKCWETMRRKHIHIKHKNKRKRKERNKELKDRDERFVGKKLEEVEEWERLKKMAFDIAWRGKDFFFFFFFFEQYVVCLEAMVWIIHRKKVRKRKCFSIACVSDSWLLLIPLIFPYTHIMREKILLNLCRERNSMLS